MTDIVLHECAEPVWRVRGRREPSFRFLRGPNLWVPADIPNSFSNHFTLTLWTPKVSPYKKPSVKAVGPTPFPQYHKQKTCARFDLWTEDLIWWYRWSIVRGDEAENLGLSIIHFSRDLGVVILGVFTTSQTWQQKSKRFDTVVLATEDILAEIQQKNLGSSQHAASMEILHGLQVGRRARSNSVRSLTWCLVVGKLSWAAYLWGAKGLLFAHKIPPTGASS